MTGCRGVPRTTACSMITQLAPTSTGPPSSVSTAPCSTQLPGPTRTRPLSTAVGAIQASGATDGLSPPCLISTRLPCPSDRRRNHNVATRPAGVARAATQAPCRAWLAAIPVLASYWLGKDERTGSRSAAAGRGMSVMFTVMTWNLENFGRPADGASQAAKDQYSGKLSQISALIAGAGPDLVGVQEVLAGPEDLAPPVFDDLLAALGAEWNGCPSERPDERGIRVG